MAKLDRTDDGAPRGQSFDAGAMLRYSAVFGAITVPASFGARRARRIGKQFPWPKDLGIEIHQIHLRRTDFYGASLDGELWRLYRQNRRKAAGLATKSGVRSSPDNGRLVRRGRPGNFDPDVWTACRIAEVADIYPACLIGSWAVALLGIRTRHWSH